MFLLHLGSRRQFRHERATETFLKNIRTLSQTDTETVVDPDTMAYYLERLVPSELSILPAKLVQTLIRSKVLDPYRLFGHFLIAIDGTRLYTFSKRHCEHCLTQTKEGVTSYYHPILAAMLVTDDGFAFPVLTEFIENPDDFKYKDKQDCELKAFYRLAPHLKDLFPRTPFCVLLDGLYDGKPVFDICENNGWKFIINFKEGSMPSLYNEAETLLELSPANRLQTSVNQTTDPDQSIQQWFGWVDDLPYEGHPLKAIFCKETFREEIKKFEYLTNLDVSRDSVTQIVNKGGRLRWKIENQGFNAQKNEGYELEHAYSLNLNAIKNFYYLLQIAHIFFQLMVKGSLFSNFIKQMGSFKNFVRRLSEHLRNILIDPLSSEEKFQIRFSSS